MGEEFSDSDELDEQDDLDSDEDEESGGTVVPKSTKNYITPKGAQTLRDELSFLLTKDRPKVVETVAWAASNGDRSENADYIYGKRRLREIDRRIRFLQKRLDAALIIDPAAQKADRVLFGATVTVEGEDGVEKTYRIVGIDETDAKRGRISWISPIGKALLQAKEGDTVVVKMPRGEEELEVRKILYQALD